MKSYFIDSLFAEYHVTGLTFATSPNPPPMNNRPRRYAGGTRVEHKMTNNDITNFMQCVCWWVACRWDVAKGPAFIQCIIYGEKEVDGFEC